MRVGLLLSYDGTDFSGWQRQGEKRCVQTVLEEAAEQIFSAPVKITASGRTDAGVHALGQVAVFDAETSIPPDRIAFCFNRLLPKDVRVLKSGEVSCSFDITREAKRKTYRYLAYFSPAEQPLLERYATLLPKEASVERMQNALRLVLGEHDFKAFRAANYTSKTSVRRIYEASVTEHVAPFGKVYVLEVTGNGFLYHMVRILAGEIFAVGMGKEEKIGEALQTGERKVLSKTMPAKGLTMVKAEFGAPLFEAPKE